MKQQLHPAGEPRPLAAPSLAAREAMRDRSLYGDLAVAGLCTLGLVLVLVMAFSDDASGPATPRLAAIGQVEQVSNEVRRRYDGRLVWRDLRTGEALYEGDAVYAGASAEVHLAMNDGSRLDIDQNSLVVVRRATAAGSFSVDLMSGAASGELSGHGLAIRTASAQVAVEERGKVLVRVQPDGSSTVEVAAGHASVKTAEKAVALAAGERGDVGADGKRATVRALEVSLASPAEGARLFFSGAPVPVDFKWAARAPGGKCEVEVSGAPSFSPVVARASSTTGGARLSGLPAGALYWRVRCRGGGEEQLSAERRLTIVQDRPPVPYGPRAEELVDVTGGKILFFAWSAVPEVETYLLELAPGSDFGRPTVRREVSGTSLRLEATAGLEEGRYCYRLRALARERGESPWSPETCFQLRTKPVLKAPKVYQPREVPVEPQGSQGSWLWLLIGGTAYAAEAKALVLELKWEAIPEAEGYIVEIAEDPAFKRVVFKQRTSTNLLQWSKGPRSEYFMRVRGVDASGREGRVSEPIRIESKAAPGVPPVMLLAPEPGKRIIAGGSVVLQWQAADSMKRFRVEISRDPAFGRDVTGVEVDGTAHGWTAPGPGEFYWRVVGIGADGQRGEPSEARNILVAAPPPEPLPPRAKQAASATGEGASVLLSWGPRPVASYEVEVAEDARFQNVVARWAGPGTSATVTVPVVGNLSWRVRGRRPDTGWSPAQSLAVLPAAPALLSPADGAAPGVPVELAWHSVRGASRYQIELEGPRGPSSVQAAENHHRLDGLAPGKYRWRVRALHASGLASEPSAARSFTVRSSGAQVAAGSPQGGAGQPAAVSARGIQLAAAVGYFVNLRGVGAFRAGAEVALRPPALGHRLTLALGIGYYTAGQQLRDPAGERSARSRLHAVPFDVVATFAVPTPLATLTLGGGPTMRVSHTTVTLAGDVLRETTVGYGAVAVLGAERPLGPGAVYAQLSYAFATRSAGAMSEGAPDGHSGMVGYRMTIW